MFFPFCPKTFGAFWLFLYENGLLKRKNTTEYRSLPGMPLSSRSEYSEKFFQRYYHQLLYFLFYRKRALPDKRAPLRYILPNKIRGSTRIFFRQRHSGATIFQRFEHPCHISANVFHNLDALHILLRFTGAHTMNGIPIERRNNQRIGQIKIIVHLVKSIHTLQARQQRVDAESREGLFYRDEYSLYGKQYEQAT